MRKILLILVAILFCAPAFAGGFNGSGTYNRFYNWQNDKANGIDITASRFDTEDNGFATGLSTTITKDGQQTTTARIPFAVGVSINQGTVTVPGLSIIGDSSTGLYQSAAGFLDFTASGTRVGGFDANGLDNTPIGLGTAAAGDFTTLIVTGSSNFEGTATIGTATIGSSKLNVYGNISIGTGEIATAAPANGAIVQGNLLALGSAAIGTASTTLPLNVYGEESVGISSTTLSFVSVGSATIGGNLTTNVTGSSQLLQVNSSGVVSGAGSPAASGSSLVLLSAQSASSSANINFNSSLITSTYNDYVILFDDVNLGTTNQDLMLQYSANNGSTMLTANYSWAVSGNCSNIGGSSGSTSDSGIHLNGTDHFITGSLGGSGEIHVSNVNTANYVYEYGNTTTLVNTGVVCILPSAGAYVGATGAINYLRIVPTSGTITSGNFYLYGIRKS